MRTGRSFTIPFPGSVIVMLAAMLPVGQALYTTGTAELLTRTALDTLGNQPEAVLVAAVLGIAILVTPFLNNVTTAVMLAPIAISVAQQSGLSVEPFLIAVAVHASTDLLTPFGHHNNTVVMTSAAAGSSTFRKSGRCLP